MQRSRSTHLKRRRATRGQATAELAIGLILLGSALIGFLQIGRLAAGNLEATIGARGTVDQRLESNPYINVLPDYYSWSNGQDGLAYTIDDNAQETTYSLDDFSSQLSVDGLRLADMPAPDSISSELNDSLSVASPLYRATGHESVRIDETYRRLFFLDRSWAHLSDQAAMPPLQID